MATFGARNVLGAFGFRGLLRLVTLITNYWPRAPLEGGGESAVLDLETLRSWTCGAPSPPYFLPLCISLALWIFCTLVDFSHPPSCVHLTLLV